MKDLIKTHKLNNDQGVDLDKLDDTQAAAVTSTDEKVVLRAPAGSGKTTTIINAVVQYRYENLNDRICAITYTRAARAEMEARLQEYGIYDVEVTTIHVWARNLLHDFSIKYDFKIKILEEPQIKAILQDIINDYSKKMRSAKTMNVNIVYSFVTGNKNMEVSDRYRSTLMALERRYVAYKRMMGLYDFTDYPLYLYDVLIAYNETINNIDALFIDEFQDVDSVQFKIFEKVLCKKKFAVGDPWQSIFVFRGADGEVFEKTADFTEYKLKYNYRSYQEIIDYAATVYCTLVDDVKRDDEVYISMITEKEDSNIVCIRGEGGFVYVVDPYGRCFRFHKDKRDRVAIDLAMDDLLSRRPMILCRTNKQVAAINALGYFECSTVHQAKGLEYDNVIVIDTTINSLESLNVAYVALTRAKNRVLVINWAQFEGLFEQKKNIWDK